MALAAVAGLFLAMAGAFGTGHTPSARRFAYWLTTMLLASAAATAICLPALRRGWLDRRPWLGGAVLTLVVALPLTAFVWLMSDLLLASGSRLADLAAYFPPVLAVSAVMTAVNILAVRGGEAADVTHDAPDARPPRFPERLAPRLRGAELYAVQAEDHYLRLHTSRGSDLILMRLTDAIAELEGLEGARTHRSWWVAKAAVISAAQADGRAVLTLKDGIEAPVSRSFAGGLKARGWF